MDIRTKNIISKYIIPYIEIINGEKIDKRQKQFKCPDCKNEKHSASIYPVGSNTMVCYRPECNFNGDIFDLVRKIEKNKDLKDDDIRPFLTKLLKIQIVEPDYKELDLYFENEWYLFPVMQNASKAPIKNFKWTEDSTTNRKLWMDWINRGYGLGVELGAKSKIIAIDIDSDATFEKVKHLLPETLIQTTKRGRHYIFKYEADFDFLQHANLRKHKDENGKVMYEMEVRANHAYIVIAPTSAEGEIREWNYKPIAQIPSDLKKFLLELINKDTSKTNAEDASIQESIDSEKLGVVDLSGRRNDTFVKLAGIFSKKLSEEQNEFVLSVISNNLIDKPIPKHELKASLEQIKKYRRYDKEEFAKEVLERLKIIKEATAYQIAGSLKRDVKDIEDVLKYLEDTRKIIDMGSRKYKAYNNVEWTTDTSDMAVPIDFEMPYFHDYAYFDYGNIIIISAMPGTGKTHLTGNLIKKFVDIGIYPDLINTEAGSKIGKVTSQLGVPPNSYAVPSLPVKHPTDIELRDDKVTIIDWLKPIQGDYSKTDATFQHFEEQLKRHKGIVIIMCQLRKDGEYFAKDQFDFYGAFVCKYLYTKKNDIIDNENTYFETTKIRDDKQGKQYIIIPTKFDKNTKILDLRK